MEEKLPVTTLHQACAEMPELFHYYIGLSDAYAYGVREIKSISKEDSEKIDFVVVPDCHFLTFNRDGAKENRQVMFEDFLSKDECKARLREAIARVKKGYDMGIELQKMILQGRLLHQYRRKFDLKLELRYIGLKFNLASFSFVPLQCAGPWT